MNNVIKIKKSKTKWPLTLDLFFKKIVSPEWWGMLNFVSKFFKKKFRKNMAKQEGIALLLTMIILSIVTLVSVFIVNIISNELKLASDINDSKKAIYAADSGVEWQLYQIRQGATVASPVMSNGATVSVTVIGSYPSFNIKSLGSFNTVKRQFEISF